MRCSSAVRVRELATSVRPLTATGCSARSSDLACSTARTAWGCLCQRRSMDLIASNFVATIASATTATTAATSTAFTANVRLATIRYYLLCYCSCFDSGSFPRVISERS